MNWFTNKKIITKILSLVGFLLSLTMGIAYLGYHSAQEINADSDDQAVSAREISMNLEMLIKAQDINTTTDELAVDPSLQNLAEQKTIFEPAKEVFQSYIPKLREFSDEKERAALDKIEAAYKTYIPLVEEVFAAVASADPAHPQETEKKVMDAMRASEGPYGELKSLLKQASDYSLQQSQIVSDRATAAYESVKVTLEVCTALAFILGLAGGIYIATRQISTPLGESVQTLKRLIDNDLNVTVGGTERQDEIGDVARAAQNFKSVLIKSRDMAEAERQEQVRKAERQKKMEQLISFFDTTATQSVTAVASASTQLSQTAEHMSKLAVDTNRQSIEVASASEQASHNVQSVASAAEEMAATVQEISRQIALSNGIVRSAMDKAESANKSSNELVEMSTAVGAIATLIEDIAGQINLLALNATIESARSGEAGKGFAVVANEVKNLATQTTKATEQIRQQLEGVQKTATGVASALGDVREAIAKVSEGSAAIAAAVEEQASATQEIVSNMNTATQGVEQINGGIFSIKSGTDSTTAATRQVLDAAKMLSAQAEKIDREVKTFLHDIVAA